MSFFDEVLTTVENNRFLRAVQDTNEPINLDLRSSIEEVMQEKILSYGSHPSFNIKNALNLDLSLTWCFLQYLSSLQLLPSNRSFDPVTNIPGLRKGKPQKYYYNPSVYIDASGQIINRATIPQRVLDKLQIDTTFTQFTPIYQAFVSLKEKHKLTEADVLRYQQEILQDGFEVAQRNEQTRNQTAATPPTSPKGNSTQNGSNIKKSTNTTTKEPSVNESQNERDEDIALDESQLRISNATSFGNNASTLSFKKIGRLLLRILQYQYQPVGDRYHTAVNLWNELFALVYAYQDQIKVIHKRIMSFRASQQEKNTSYYRRLKERLMRVYLNHERYRRRRNQILSPSMENAGKPGQDQENKKASGGKNGKKEKATPQQTAEAAALLRAIFPALRRSNTSLFVSVPATSAGTTVPYESLPKAFTSIPMREQAYLMAVDPALLLLAYLIADGVLHHLFKIISDSVKAYDLLEVKRIERLITTLQEQDNFISINNNSSVTSSPGSEHRKSTIASTTSRLGALLSASKQDPEELKRVQKEQLWLRRKALIIRLHPFEGYYTGQNQSPDLATAAQQPLGTLTEDDDEGERRSSTTHTSNLHNSSQPEPNPYNIFDGIEYIAASGPPHEDILNEPYSPIYFAPDLFVPLVRCPVLYPLLEPLLLKSDFQSGNTTTTTPAGATEGNIPSSSNTPNHSTTDQAPNGGEGTELVSLSTTNQKVIPNPAMSTHFIESQFFVVWVKVQEYLESPWDLEEHFDQFRILGRGAFGTVTGVQHSKLQSMYAVKEISKKMVKVHGKGHHFMVKNECRMLKSVQSPFVLHLHAALDDREKLYLFTDICLGGDLSHHLKQQPSRRFHYARARFYAAQIILGLEHIHERLIVYRDLKPSNILLDSDGNAKISDLGLSLRLPKDGLLRHVAGTAGYWAPEVVSKCGTTVTSDYWSLGVMLYEMLCGHRPKLRTDIYAKRGKEVLKERQRAAGKNAATSLAKVRSEEEKLSIGYIPPPQNQSVSRSRQSFGRTSQHDDSGSEGRTSGHGLGLTPKGQKNGEEHIEILESELYLKFDRRMHRAHDEYYETIKTQFISNKQLIVRDLANVPTERINFKNTALFTPTGQLINPLTTHYTPSRFMLLPPVLTPAMAANVAAANATAAATATSTTTTTTIVVPSSPQNATSLQTPLGSTTGGIDKKKIFAPSSQPTTPMASKNKEREAAALKKEKERQLEREREKEKQQVMVNVNDEDDDELMIQEANNIPALLLPLDPAAVDAMDDETSSQPGSPKSTTEKAPLVPLEMNAAPRRARMKRPPLPNLPYRDSTASHYSEHDHDNLSNPPSRSAPCSTVEPNGGSTLGNTPVANIAGCDNDDDNNNNNNNNNNNDDDDDEVQQCDIDDVTATEHNANNNNNNNNTTTAAGTTDPTNAATKKEKKNNEEVGSMQTQVMDLLKDEDQEEVEATLECAAEKKKRGNNNNALEDDDYDDTGTPSSTPLPSTFDGLPTPTSPNTPVTLVKETPPIFKPVLPHIIPDIMSGCQIKSALYDKTKDKHLLLAPGLGTSSTHHHDRFIIGATAENVPVRSFRVMATTEDNTIPASEIQRATDLYNNQRRWSPFDPNIKTETTARTENSILDVDVDYNIDSAYLTCDVVDFFIRLFDPDPYSRLGARGIEEIKEHPFFTNPIAGFGAIDWDRLSQRLIVPPYRPETNTVHAKSMDELQNSPQDKNYKNTRMTAEDDQMYATWYHTDQEHREKEIVRILNNNVNLSHLLWGSNEKKEGSSKKSSGGGCCEIM